jgi:hypothetical protein
MKVSLLGATGFVGSSLLKEALDRWQNEPSSGPMHRCIWMSCRRLFARTYDRNQGRVALPHCPRIADWFPSGNHGDVANYKIVPHDPQTSSSRCCSWRF